MSTCRVDEEFDPNFKERGSIQREGGEIILRSEKLKYVIKM